jgi:hypothetical protein
MKIAFRKTNGPGLSGLFNRYTKWSLKTGYSHGGVVIGDQLWHTTADGVMPEPFEPSEAWDLFESGLSDKIALERCTEVLGMRYDPASLLGFKLPIRVTDAKGLYCFELQWLVLTGEHPRNPISPDTVMAELLRRLNAQALPTRTVSDWPVRQQFAHEHREPPVSDWCAHQQRTQAHPTRTAFDRGSDGHGGFPDTIGPTSYGMAAKHDLSGSGAADLHVRLDSSLGNQK